MERLKPIVGFNAKIIEKTGQKMRNTLSNSDPWKGMECGRHECLTCSQEEEQKLDCRKRSLIYENICELCNPREEKETKNKTWEDLRDKRETPSIYVGETSRSICERAKNHWKDLEGRDEDSHMLKHWESSHGGEGKPKFRFKIVKFCRSALERQVGEATRILLRGNTLNSKAGYNRSGLTRLTLRQEDTWKDPTCRYQEPEVTEGINIMQKKANERAEVLKEKNKKKEEK